MKVEDIFLAALEKKTPAERQAYLDSACGSDADVRAQVESLLRSHLEAGSFLDAPLFDPPATSDQPAAEQPGSQIGPYKLLAQIGEGGMGVVYLAEQSAPIVRRVALKIIKPGMDSRQVIARFEAERQALALMDHLNIARVLDAGTTPAGRPYFVMELINGVPITKYCDDHQLNPRQRLELFVPVCQAIQHAHQKGIIHRDIKPTNVLVTLYDGQAVPKVIDFGVAKATQRSLTERTLFTQFGAMVGTPQYMSPEQAETSTLSADTRSDIFSLGVLLYELLTGTTPLSQERIRDAAYLEVLRMIKEEEPARPSTRLSDSGEALASIAAQRHMEPAQLTKLLRGELDWIVMKTLEKDRNRRYDSANALAADVQRYLCDETVQACPPSAWYRFRKFARRHKAVLASAAAGALALLLAVIGLAVNNWLVARERDEKKAALQRVVQEKERADQNMARARRAVREYLNKAVANTRHGVADPHLLRKDLLATAVPFYTEFVRQKQDDPALAAEQGRAYGDLAFLWEELGEWEQARAAHEQELAIFARLASEFPNQPDFRHQLASAQFNRGNVYHELDQQAKAQEAYQAAIAVLEPLVAGAPAVPQYRQDLAGTYNNLAASLRRMGRREEALIAFQKASDHQERLAAEHSAQPRTRLVLAIGCMSRATLLNELGRHDEALTSCRRAADQFENLATDFPRVSEYREGWAGALKNVSVFLCGLGRPDEAVTVHRKAISIQEQLVKDFSSLPVHRQDLAASHTNLGVLLGELGRNEEALASHDRSLVIAEQLGSDFPGDLEHRRILALSQCNRGDALRGLGRNEEALDAYRRAVSIQRQLAASLGTEPRNRQDLARSQHNLADLLTGLGQNDDEALASLQSALTTREQLAAESPTNTQYMIELAGSQGTMGNLRRDWGQPEDALAWYAKAIDRLEQLLSRDARFSHAQLFARNILRGRAVAFAQLDRHTDALRDYDRALELDDGQYQTALRRERALTLARLQETARALPEADALVAKPDADAQTLYAGACIYALSSIASAATAVEAERNAVRAVVLLRRAVEKGYQDLATLKEDKDLDSLRTRDDFGKLLAELEAKED